MYFNLEAHFAIQFSVVQTHNRTFCINYYRKVILVTIPASAVY